MIEINNTFILVWLVVLAIICIYLLYMSLSRTNEADTLKGTVTNLVRQNKKRDELINFLMERVETLTNVVNTMTNTTSVNITEPVHVDLVKQQTADVVQTPDKSRELSLDEVLESIPQNTLEGMQLNENSTENVAPINNLQHEEFNLDILPEANSEFAEISNNTYSHIAESGDSVPELHKSQQKNLNLDDVLNSIPSTFKDDDLISTILGADDSASQQCNEDHSNLPPEKIKLLGMSVKQLKQIAKDMNIKSRGNKTDLVENIWEKKQQQEQSSEPETGNTVFQAQNVGTNDNVDGTQINSMSDMELLPNNPTTPILPTQLLVEELPDDI